MKLTGKCKEDFEGWLDKQRFKPFGYDLDASNMGSFYNMAPQFQWGVIQDFADSVGYGVETEVYYTDVNYFHNHYSIIYNEGLKNTQSKPFNSRQEARTAAIEKFNELYNNGKE